MTHQQQQPPPCTVCGECPATLLAWDDAPLCQPSCHVLHYAAHLEKTHGRKRFLIPITVARVTDGDTIVDTAGAKYRLQDIDSPELAQPGGQAARAHLMNLIWPALRAVGGNEPRLMQAADTGPQIYVNVHGQDRYRRLLATVYRAVPGRPANDAEDLNARMVEDGHAWVYNRALPADNVWMQREAHARETRLGLWATADQDPPELPQAYRRRVRRKRGH